jgi:membrane protein DedA with SNARE-associated domain
MIQQWVYSVLDWLTDLGYLGIALGLMIEVIPSEVVLAYGGFLIANGKINFIGAVVAGVIGGVMAQLFLYWLGCYGGRPFLDRYGKYLLIHHKHLNIAEKYMKKYGTGMIFGARFIPVVRHAISIPAGITKMPILRFTILTTLAILPWSIVFLYIGMTLGRNWKEIQEVAEPYMIPIALLATILLLIYICFHGYQTKRDSK